MTRQCYYFERKDAGSLPVSRRSLLNVHQKLTLSLNAYEIMVANLM